MGLMKVMMLILFATSLLMLTRATTFHDEDEQLLQMKQVKSSRVSAPSPAPTPLVKPPTVSAPSKAPIITPAPAPVLPPVRSKEDCIPLCDARCKLHSRKRLCARACMTCCDRCKCVPPGTYGNREMCGKCYTDMTTHGLKTKCP